MSAITRRRFLQAAGVAAAGLAGLPAAGAEEKPLKFKLGLVTYNVAKDWDLDTVLRVCKNVGIAAVELRTTHKHGVEPTLTKDQRKEVRKKFADSGVEFWGCGTVCEFHDPSPDVVKKNVDTCKEFVELVADIGGRGVKVRPNGLPKDVPVDKTLEQIGKALIQCGKAAADAKLEIWVEVHGGGPADPKGTAHPPYVKTMMETCDLPNVGVTWNSNPGDVKDKSVADYFKLLRPWIKSCHINDLENDAKGTYPYRELFRLFRETDYDRVTECEVGKAYDPEAGEKFLAEYKKLWEQLARP
jgi:sugar phosphate isomerase/epimerase